MTSDPPLAYRRLRPGYEALGLVLDFLTRSSPFDVYQAGPLAAAIRHQLNNSCHITAVRGEVLVGYAGWLFVTEPMGEAWLQGTLKELGPVPEAQSTAAALTIVRSESREASIGLMRSCRTLGAGRRIYFKRDYAPGKERRNTVFTL